MLVAPSAKIFSEYLLNSTNTLGERALGFLYFRSKFNGGSATLKDIMFDFEASGLGRQNSTRVRKFFIQNRRVKTIKKDTWIIPADKLKDIEIALGLTDSPGAKGKKKVEIKIKKTKTTKTS